MAAESGSGDAVGAADDTSSSDEGESPTKPAGVIVSPPRADETSEEFKLPEALMRQVFSFLTLQQMSKAAIVCRRWHAFIENDDRWKRLCAQEGVTSKPSSEVNFSWLRTYVTMKAVSRNFMKLSSTYSTKTFKKGHKKEVWCMDHYADRLITGSSDRTAKIWDASSLSCIRTLKPMKGGVWALHFDEAANTLVMGDTEGYVRVCDLDTGEMKREFEAHVTTVSALQLENDTLVTASFDNSVCVWDMTTHQAKQVLQGSKYGGHKFHIWCLKMADRKVVSGGWDCKIKIWDLTKGMCTMSLGGVHGHTGPVRCLAFDGFKVVSGSWDKTVKLWDIRKTEGKPVFTLEGHTGPVSGIKADSRKILSASYDGTVKLWDLVGNPPPCIRTIKAHPGGVMCASFDWRRIYTGGKDKKTKMFDFSHKFM